MNDIKDLFTIDKRIGEINKERTKLSNNLSELRRLSDINSDRNQFYENIANDITNNINDLNDIETLREKYGNLQILDSIESKLIEQLAIDSNVKELNSIECEIDKLSSTDCQDITSDQIVSLHGRLSSILSEGHMKNSDPRIKAVIDKFDTSLISRYCNHFSEEFNQLLLNSKWDTPKFLLSDSTQVYELRRKSSELFKITVLYISPDNKTLWNFKSIASNFQIRFAYHFHDSSLNIETYFKFLNDYLKENLYKCISIFLDENIGMKKELIHEEFINHVLQPMRDHINAILSRNDLNSLITLISQIVTTDKNLFDAFHYHGNGLVSLISNRFWDMWIDYEIVTIQKQFDLIINDPKDLRNSGTNFIKLLRKVYDYLEPFYELNYEPLMKYKLKTCSEIFMNLSSKYLDYVLTTDSLPEQHTKEDELDQTITKLELLNVVYKKIAELPNKYVFVTLTNVVNQRESKRYITLFQNILRDYQNDMETDLQNSVIHRIQKMIKESVRTYFKVGYWIITDNITDQSPKSEVINTINILTRLMHRIELSDIPNNILFNIKNELLNIVVNYFVESILKLNKFNETGLNQFQIDFVAVKSALQLPEDCINSHECMVYEILRILRLKYDPKLGDFVSSSYIRDGEFNDLKEYLNIKYLENSEIQDALYRISYGNIV